MSNLTPELEERFYWLKEMCTSAGKGEAIGPLMIRDKIVELEELVEDVLTPKCAGCGEPLEEWLAGANLCSDCFRKQGYLRICPQCWNSFYTQGVSQLECDRCIADQDAHIEEVQQAHAATNGTL